MKHARIPLWFALFTVGFLGAALACSALVRFAQASATLTPLPATTVASTTPTLGIPTASSATCQNGDCTNACITQLSAIPQSSGSSETRPKAAGQGPSGAPARLLVTYPVNGNQLGDPQYPRRIPPNLSGLQHDTTAQQKIWDYFAAMIPADRRSKLTYYMVSTDDRGGMLASVEQFSGRSESWALVVDPADASRPRDLTFTLLHEFGHLLTLNSSQVRPDQAVLEHPDNLQIYAREAASCAQYFASGGCSLPDSYINQFFDQFWTKIYREWTAVNAARQKTNYMALLAHFYSNHPTQFITPYSSTSPEEDMAETWAYFVLNPKPAADSIAHRKVLFFYAHPELVDLRNEIINGICNYAATQ